MPALFTADPAIRHAATVALLVAALTQPVAALAFVLDGLILGISDYVAMRRAMILAIAAYVPVAALVLAFHGLGLPGIWVALGLWLAARAALLGRRWQAQFGLPAASLPFLSWSFAPRARPCDARASGQSAWMAGTSSRACCGSAVAAARCGRSSAAATAAAVTTRPNAIQKARW